MQITFVPLVPPVLVQLLKTPTVTSRNLSPVRHILYAAAPTGVELEKEWDIKFKNIERRQGLSEFWVVYGIKLSEL